jgi:hypothetical protein
MYNFSVAGYVAPYTFLPPLLNDHFFSFIFVVHSTHSPHVFQHYLTFSPAITADLSAASTAHQQPSTPTDPNITRKLTDLQDSANDDDTLNPQPNDLNMYG